MGEKLIEGPSSQEHEEHIWRARIKFVDLNI